MQLQNGTPGFQNTCFKVEALKIFKISHDYHIKMCRSKRRRAILIRRKAILSISGTSLLEKPTVFLLVLK